MRLIFLLGLFLVASAFASVNKKLPNDHLAYYGEEFYEKFPRVSKDELFEILSQNHRPNYGDYDDIGDCKSNRCYAHHAVGYSAARKILFGPELFGEKVGNGLMVEDVYCGKRFHYKSVNDVSNMHTKVNIEHTWPQSKFSRRFSKELQKSDMHHLYPTDSQANSRRGNFRFGEVSQGEDDLNVQGCDASRFSTHRGPKFNPPDEHVGNVARSLFYFATRYDMEISQSEEMVLRLWHIMDPVDEDEIRRHEVIARYQNVRNPFIDYPELVDMIKDF